MEKQDKNILVAFVLGAFAIFSLYVIFEAKKKKRNQRLESLKLQLDNGFDIDKSNIESDFKNIYSDIEKAKSRLMNESYETV